MTLSRHLGIMLLLTAALLAASVAWTMLRHRTHAPERARWSALTSGIETGRERIDSLEVALAAVDERLQREKRALERAAERIAHYERTAVSDRLPTPAFRSYQETIAAHNETVTLHNDLVAEQQRIYGEYSAAIDHVNALVDSANALQRAAVQEGFTLEP